MREGTVRTLPAGGVGVEVTWKRVRRLSLRVGADGRARASVPVRTTLAEAEAFLAEHGGWVARQVARQAQAARQLADPEDGGFVWLWGRRANLVVDEADGAPAGGRATLADGTVRLSVRPGATDAQRAAAVDALLAQELLGRVGELAPRLEDRVGRHASRWRARRMTSRWGSCNTRTASITLNLALAELEPRCLEGVMVHELCHLWVRAHDARFYALMDEHFPAWREVRRELRAHEPTLRAETLRVRGDGSCFRP